MRHKEKTLKSGVTTKKMRNILNQCKVCEQRINVRRSTIFDVNDSQYPEQELVLDFVGSIDGVYLLVKVDYFTKVVRVNLCEREDSKQVIRGLEGWWSARGRVSSIQSD